MALTRRRLLLLTWITLLFPLLGCGLHPKESTTESNTMRISFERSGGFAGMLMTTTVDTGTLPPEQANQLRQLVEAADFFHLPATITSPNPQADRFQYRLTVEENGQQHTIRVSEQAAPAALKPLLEWLINAARRR